MNTSSSRFRLRFLPALLVAFSLLAGGAFLLPQTALAEGSVDEAKTYSAEEPPDLASTHALLVDEKTDTVLYDKGSTERCYPASLTKVMTAIVVLDNAELDEEVTVEEGDFDEVTPESSVAGFKAGETLTVRDLLAGLLLPSGNDASYVLARYVGGGDWYAFVDMMNKRAAELGCTDTHFVNPCGLHDDDHYTTARDLVTMFEAALEYPDFKEIASCATWDLPATSENPARTLENTNLLLDPESPVYMDGIIGASKTGSTIEGGKCLIVEANQGERSLVCVVLGAPMAGNSKGITSNFYDAKALVEWGFGAWKTGEVVKQGDRLATVDVEFSSEGDEVGIEAASSLVGTVPVDLTLDDLTITPLWTETLRAPLTEGSTVGEVTVALGDQQLGTVSVAPARSVGLSIPDFVVWWITSDFSHALIVAVVAVALFVLIGVICSIRAKKRRLREKRLKVSVNSVNGITTGVVGAGKASRGNHGSSHGKKDAAPKSKPSSNSKSNSKSKFKGNSKGGGRHMRQ